MDQIKIGKFIAECRKKEKLTQSKLAEKLSITDRAVSKWERGKSLPDASLMLDLCRILKISVNDLLNGEVVLMENYNEKMEQSLIEIAKEKEEADKRLLRLEIVVGFLCIFVFLALTVFASYAPLSEALKVTLILIGFLPLLIATPFMLKIEQKAGYYRCSECGYRYVPTFKSVFMAPHMGRTRRMRCPECSKKTWQKKVISKD